MLPAFPLLPRYHKLLDVFLDVFVDEIRERRLLNIGRLTYTFEMDVSRFGGFFMLLEHVLVPR